MKNLPLISGILIMLAMYACKSEVLEAPDSGQAYFKIDQGSYIAYDVDSIVIDIPSGIQDTFVFQIKEYIDSAFFDLEGRPTARIHRSYRDQAADPWILKKVWTANRGVTKAEKVEENVRFVKMVFPVTADIEWDGNAQNTFNAWNYSYQEIDAPRNIGSLAFQRTVTVDQRDLSNLIEKEFAQEIYAYDVGMVYKQLDILKYSLSGGVQTLLIGVKFKMTAFEYGHE